MNSLIKYTLLRRKPIAWTVRCDGREGVVSRGPDETVRGSRWRLQTGELTMEFRSRREAFCFFATGTLFTVKPPKAPTRRAR
jgi:hypothetical protein